MLPRYPRQLQDFAAALPVCSERVRIHAFTRVSLVSCCCCVFDPRNTEQRDRCSLDRMGNTPRRMRCVLDGRISASRYRLGCFLSFIQTESCVPFPLGYDKSTSPLSRSTAHTSTTRVISCILPLVYCVLRSKASSWLSKKDSKLRLYRSQWLSSFLSQTARHPALVCDIFFFDACACMCS